MPRSAWHCAVVSGAGSSPDLRIGPLTSGTTLAEASCAAPPAAGTATLAAGAASDIAASPPAAAAGRKARTVTRLSADRPCDAARAGDRLALRAAVRENPGILLL